MKLRSFVEIGTTALAASLAFHSIKTFNTIGLILPEHSLIVTLVALAIGLALILGTQDKPGPFVAAFMVGTLFGFNPS